MRKCRALAYFFPIFLLLLAGQGWGGEPISLPEDYQTLHNLVGQWFFFDQEVFFNAVMFVQDRNHDGEIDLIEYRVMGEKYWEPYTYKLIIDDNFDGYANRKITSSKRDGVFDREKDVREQGVKMKDIYLSGATVE
ncbi:MAG: hypothetical protein D6736_21585 [Nitrospinota bacterium]|nr:MAG: hypothetical protein D6736_21585 [Nitrospinota bacterium]